MANFGMADAKNYIFLLFPIECVSPLRHTLSMFCLLIHLKATLCFPYTARGSISSAIGPRPTPFSLSFAFLPSLTDTPAHTSSVHSTFSEKGHLDLNYPLKMHLYSQTTFLPHSTDKLFTRHPPLCVPFSVPGAQGGELECGAEQSSCLITN